MFLKSKFWIIIFLCLGLTAQAQESFRVMFYNVENLFDTKDDKHKNDNDFLPQSSRKWTYHRYKEKLNHIAKTIIASGNSHVPDLVGLCEVENDVCMRDLIKYSPLREADYRYEYEYDSNNRILIHIRINIFLIFIYTYLHQLFS